MNLTVFGIGYVGLVQAAVLAEVGHEVVCVDIDEKKVERLNQGLIPIFEPGLEKFRFRNLRSKAGDVCWSCSSGITYKYGCSSTVSSSWTVRSTGVSAFKAGEMQTASRPTLVSAHSWHHGPSRARDSNFSNI